MSEIEDNNWLQKQDAIYRKGLRQVFELKCKDWKATKMTKGRYHLKVAKLWLEDKAFAGRYRRLTMATLHCLISLCSKQ